MPVPSFNVINGGSHAGNRLACQEFMILPTGCSTFKEAMIVGAEVYHTLKGCIKKKYGQDACNVGDEGGFAPSVQDNDEALDVLMDAIEKSGHKDKVKIGTDVAASEFYDDKAARARGRISELELLAPLAAPPLGATAGYQNWLSKYPLVSIEDPFDQDDWDAYKLFMDAVGKDVQVVGDDLLVTNPKRIAKGMEGRGCSEPLFRPLAGVEIQEVGRLHPPTALIIAPHWDGWVGWGGREDVSCWSLWGYVPMCCPPFVRIAPVEGPSMGMARYHCRNATPRSVHGTPLSVSRFFPRATLMSRLTGTTPQP
ncbi:unnamed protein product [Prorocentrum cordatum]|uniref:phosphopyruvate hydratase n=1 Tax=Prorocentrum cordatum TaxID=2364126 RepID=A0ABN9UD03_9DINO|nr:unnamed protein product [Polarella glacialis]